MCDILDDTKCRCAVCRCKVRDSETKLVTEMLIKPRAIPSNDDVGDMVAGYM